ncbi:hypothetical protein WICMUC_002725 [Wickerhamomyces mucosus]|uniref:Phosphatidate cytidylyltransferase, mitochondrial n=1 Tax=Wickerhamomyces mucosus TaxID=1378264 RepID=A0A9P8TE03_9ASCO|nr:hypothetical protein WICMUC_002725 [Wickerhamomyces mucosus]
MLHYSLRPRARQSAIRFLSSIERSHAKELEDSVFLGKGVRVKPSIKSQPKESNEDLRILDESIRKAEYLAKNFTTDSIKLQTRLPPNFATNQHLAINNSNELSSLLWNFDAPIRHAFAYGSGVFSQGYSDPNTQIDLIFGVTYPAHWHSINMKRNKHHYSTLKYFGSSFISQFQDIGAGVYFNPFVEIDGKLIKYGVVSIDKLIEDLASWKSFYLAGRLQKPVKILRDDTMIKFWNQQNLRAAATLAYLNLPEDKPFDEFQFYRNITELSYNGDIRYLLGAENPQKIDNIVSKNFNYFQQYYSPILSEVIQDKHFVLPPGFTKENANQRLKDIIFKSSSIQTAKGLFSAGLSKSIKYAYAKRLKASKK